MAITSEYYNCNKCRFKTTLLSRIEKHLVHSYRDIKQLSPFSYFDCFDHLKPIKCTNCDFRTESLVLLRYHRICNHDQRKFVLKAKLKTCKKCGFCTHSNYLWIKHSIFATCKGKKDSKGTEKEIIVLKKRNRKWQLCEKCDYRTRYLNHLKKHVITKHTPLDEIHWQYCKKCTAKFKLPDDLKRHQKNVHAFVVDHLRCPECDYSTPSRNTLTTHLYNKHTRPEEIKWVECYECGAKFKDKGRLKRHLIRHTTREKQYKCDWCPFETHHKHSLRVHIKRHLKKEEVKCEKWFKCEHCDFSTKYKNHLKNHVLGKHSIDGEVFQCEQCPYNSRSKRYLTNHITVMHKQKFNCENCSFVTTTKVQLKSHMFNKHTVHIEEEKLNCDHCTYFCFNKKYLKKHLKDKHKIGDKKKKILLLPNRF